MQLGRLWEVIAIPARARILWERITFSRITKFYFIFSVLHCFVQIVFQIQAFTINAQAADFIFSLVEQGNAFNPGFAVLNPDDDGLRWCDTIPNTISSASCQVIWNASAKNVSASEPSGAAVVSSSSILPSSTVTAVGVATESAPPALIVSSTSVTETTTTTRFVVASGTSSTSVSAATPSTVNTALNDLAEVVNDLSQPAKRSDPATTIVAAVNVDGLTEVTIQGPGWNDKKVNLTEACLIALNWPVERLHETKREDVTFVAFQIWLLGMSIVALLNESIPHIIASLLTHILATSWASFQIIQTQEFHTDFAKLTTDGACGINLLPNYWKTRADAEIPSLALNVVALLLSVFLSWRLIKLFGWQTFKRVGASRTVNRVYMLVLSLSISIQLSLFFIVSSIGLWIDQLFNGPIGMLATRAYVMRPVLITVLCLLFPWLTLGWIAVRRELRIPMMIFLIMSIGYLAGWGGMFASTSFRWTFVEWRFFSLITAASVLLTISTFVLGLMCRLNFGKGLSRYLKAQEPLSDDDGMSEKDRDSFYNDMEKVDFPSMQASVPTFSVAFGRGAEVPPPSQMKFGPPRLGPRFTNPSMEPFDPQPGDADAREVSLPAPVHVRAPSSASTHLYGMTELTRQQSNASQKSTSSSFSKASSGSVGSLGRARQWVIE